MHSQKLNVEGSDELEFFGDFWAKVVEYYDEVTKKIMIVIDVQEVVEIITNTETPIKTTDAETQTDNMEDFEKQLKDQRKEVLKLREEATFWKAKVLAMKRQPEEDITKPSPQKKRRLGKENRKIKSVVFFPRSDVYDNYRGMVLINGVFILYLGEINKTPGRYKYIVDTESSAYLNNGNNKSEKKGEICHELNGRKITVLYEGVGDPQRTPVFVRDLTTDQKDILNQRLNDHRTGKSTKCVNTDEEIRELQKKPPTNDAYTQTNFTTDISLLEVLLKNSTQVQQLLPQLSKRKHPDQLEETNNPSLVEYLQSENINFLMVQIPKK
ncbi:unnamed protein product [Mytilus edulis]|uniref:Uncharacterized protein n=1 Tax=Mytilus edulis TaxID=6550 RepID=A0A8S3T2C4_MYTED|nr:unnamed protein product [Mytilus edulis]